MQNWIRVLLIGLCLVVPVILLGCGSLDNDTGPTDPGGGTGNNPPGGGAASFNITVTANPPTLVANGLDLSLITVHVRDADTGRSVPNGTAVTLHTTLGALNTDGSITGDPIISVSVMNGMAIGYLASGLRSGTAVVTATVGRSSGQVSVPIYDPPEE